VQQTFELRSRVLRPLPERLAEYAALFEERNRHIVGIDHVRFLMRPRIDVLRAAMTARVEALTAEMNSAVAEHEREIARIDALMDPMIHVANT